MKVLAVLLALAGSCLYVQAQNVVCGKGTSSKTITLEDGKSYSFKTHKGKKYKGNTECTVDYKMGDTCAEMSFACTKFNTNNKDKKKCKKGDMVTITANGKAKAYCKTKKPKVTSSGDMQVVFSSDAKKHSSGAVCKVTCTEAASTTATTTEAAGGAGVSCGPEACGLTCLAGVKCVENDEIVCVTTPCCPRWSCNETLAKTEGESCGSCFCPPTYSAGECEEGLTCVHDPNIADAPGICEKKAKKEGESCGSCFCPPTFSAGECEAGLTCVSNPNIPDLPGVCESITVPPVEG